VELRKKEQASNFISRQKWTGSNEKIGQEAGRKQEGIEKKI